MDPGRALKYVAGLLLFLILVQALASPLRILLRLLGNSAAGALILWVINLLGHPFDFHLGLNPVSAVVVGVLGVPGLLGLGLIQLLFG